MIVELSTQRRSSRYSVFRHRRVDSCLPKVYVTYIVPDAPDSRSLDAVTATRPFVVRVWYSQSEDSVCLRIGVNVDGVR